MGKHLPTTVPERASEPATGGPRSLRSSLSRRSLLAGIVEMAGVIVTLLLAIPFVRFVVYAILRKSSAADWFDLGPASSFSSLTAPSLQIVRAQTTDGWLRSESNKAVYAIKDRRGHLEVLTAVCPHLGCTVQWDAAKNEFHCPCHGSVFAPDGSHIAGPAPRGMDSLPISIEGGELKVRYESFRQLVSHKEAIS